MKNDPGQFRKITRKRLTNMVAQVGLPNVPLDQEFTLIDGLLEITDRLKAYQEEGLDLRPEFIIFREEDHRELRNTTEVSHFFEISNRKPLALQTFRDAVKHCAPLAHGDWAAFVKLRSSSVAYGVVRRRNSIIDPQVFASPETQLAKAPPFLRIRQVERHIVEVQGPGKIMQVYFSVAEAGLQEDTAHTARAKLLDALTRKAFRSKKAPVRAVLEEAFDRALSYGHGFLVAIAAGADGSTEFPSLDKLRKKCQGLFFEKSLIPTQLKVAELVKWRFRGNPEEIQQVLDFIESHGQHPGNLTAFADRLTSTYAEVEAWSQLISSMLLTDGITLFDDRGNVLGFRLFIQSQGTKETDGGARRLAFESMKNLVREKALVGAYYQSQDGHAIFYS